MISQNRAFQARFYSLLLFVFFLPFSAAVVNIAIGLAIVIWLFEKIYFKDFKIFEQLKYPLICLGIIVLFAFLSFLNTELIHNSVRGVIKILKWTLLIVVTADTLKTRRELKWILGAWLASAFLISVDGLYQYIVGHDFLRANPIQYFNPGINRIRATYSHTTLLAGYLDPILAVLMTLGLYYFRGVKQLLFIVMGLVITVCFILTWTRIAVIAVVAAVLVMCWMHKDKWIPSLMVALGVGGYFLLPGKIVTWIAEQKDWVGILFNDDRIWMMTAGLNMIKAHPWVGVGAGTFSNQYINYKLAIDPFDTNFGASNYIQMGAEIGVVAVMALFVFLGLVFYKSYRAYFKVTDPFIRASFLGIFGAALIYVLHGFMDCNLYFSKLAPLFGFLMGLVSATPQFLKENDEAVS